MGETRCEAMERRIRALEARVSALERGKPAKRAYAGKIDNIIADYPIDMNKTQAAGALGVTRATIYTMITDGRLEANGRGHVLTQSVIRLLTAPTLRKGGKENAEGECKEEMRQ